MDKSKHYQLATSLLKEVEDQANRFGFIVHHDPETVFHIGLEYNNQHWSVFCSGFNKRLDLQKLTKTGKPDRRFTEQGFFGLKSLFNFLNRRAFTKSELIPQEKADAS